MESARQESFRKLTRFVLVAFNLAREMRLMFPLTRSSAFCHGAKWAGAFLGSSFAWRKVGNARIKINATLNIRVMVWVLRDIEKN